MGALFYCKMQIEKCKFVGARDRALSYFLRRDEKLVPHRSTVGNSTTSFVGVRDDPDYGIQSWCPIACGGIRCLRQNFQQIFAQHVNDLIAGIAGFFEVFDEAQGGFLRFFIFQIQIQEKCSFGDLGAVGR